MIGLEELTGFNEKRGEVCKTLEVDDDATKEATGLIAMEMARCHEKIPTVNFIFVDFEEDASGKIRMTSNLISTKDAPHIVDVATKVLSYIAWRYKHVEINSNESLNAYETYKDHTRRWHFEYIF